MIEIKNRSRLGRENAGLSVGQSARLLGVATDELLRIEASDSCYANADQSMMADVYGVNIEWLSGRVERHDYASVDRMTGADNLTFHDRDVIAEFAASMPRKQNAGPDK